MRGNELLDKMELADPAYVEAADRKPLRKRRGWIPWAAAAACLCLLIAAIPVFSQKPSTPQEGTTDYGGPPRVAVNGRTYVISPYLANAEELPDGFTYAGTTDVDNGFEDCAYYTNPDIPEWIYVYQEVRTDGTVDETGTLVSTPPHNAYTRYVDERLRGKKLVCFDGNYYISMWRSMSSTEYRSREPCRTASRSREQRRSAETIPSRRARSQATRVKSRSITTLRTPRSSW